MGRRKAPAVRCYVYPPGKELKGEARQMYDRLLAATSEFATINRYEHVAGVVEALVSLRAHRD